MKDTSQLSLDLRQEIGYNVTVTRCELGMSQTALAKKSGCSRFTILRLEHGEKVVSFAVIRAVCRALQVPLSKIVPGEKNYVSFSPVTPQSYDGTRKPLRFFDERIPDSSHRGQPYKDVFPVESFSGEDELQAPYGALVSALTVGDLCERYSIKRGWVPVVVTKEMLPVISQNPGEFRLASKENQEIRDLLAASEAPSTAKLIDLLGRAKTAIDHARKYMINLRVGFEDNGMYKKISEEIATVLPIKS